jgi:hypothetical protein
MNILTRETCLTLTTGCQLLLGSNGKSISPHFVWCIVHRKWRCSCRTWKSMSGWSSYKDCLRGTLWKSVVGQNFDLLDSCLSWVDVPSCVCRKGGKLSSNSTLLPCWLHRRCSKFQHLLRRNETMAFPNIIWKAVKWTRRGIFGFWFWWLNFLL